MAAARCTNVLFTWNRSFSSNLQKHMWQIIKKNIIKKTSFELDSCSKPVVNLRGGKLKAFLIFTTLLIVFGFAGQKIRVAFQRTNEGWFRRFITTTFLFKFFEFGFYNIFFVILEKKQGCGSDEHT